MKVTPQYVQGLIDQAIDSGASAERINELKSYLEQIKSVKLKSASSGKYTYKTKDDQGKTIVRRSTVPITPGDDSNFEGLSFRSC